MKSAALQSFVRIETFWSFQQVADEFNNPIVLLFKYMFH